MAVLGRKGRDGGTFSSAPCANAGVPAGHLDMLRASPARILTAARMTSSVRVPRPFVFMKAHIVGELRGDPRLHKCVLRLLLRVCGSYIPQYSGFELALSRAPVECAHTSKKLSLSDRRPMIDDQ